MKVTVNKFAIARVIPEAKDIIRYYPTDSEDVAEARVFSTQSAALKELASATSEFFQKAFAEENDLKVVKMTICQSFDED